MKPLYLIKTISIAALVSCTYGCADETFPNDNYLTEDQIDSSNPTVVQGYANAIVSQMGKVATYSTGMYYDIGYTGLNMIRDMWTSDYPIYSKNYDYFYYYEADAYMGEYSTSGMIWNYYYSLVMQCNNMLRLPYSEKTSQYFAMAHFYRAWFYFDMARYYEYKDTGYEDKDALAKSRNLYGLTCPIVDENTTEKEATNQPRASYAEMYKFILKDINDAQEMIGTTVPTAKYMPSPATVRALKSKVYMELASHMEQRPEDLQGVSQADGFEALTAADAYRVAEKYADDAIRMHSGSPLTEDEWYGGANYSTGFNTLATPSWMLGITISKEILSAAWYGFISYASIETTYGIAGVTYDSSTDVYYNAYQGQRCMGADLYSKISNKDWRKKTWIDPADAGNAAAVSNYKTKVAGAYFEQLPAYAGFKYRPGSGNMIDYSVGSAVDYPLMRIEEMYFVKAEAMAHTTGLAAAGAYLQQFINTYRYTDGSFICNASSMDGFIDELMRQKRIEFWGEGIMAHDYKRLNLRVYRYYDNTNFVDRYAFNSYKGKCAPWLNGFIRRSEVGKNPALVQNPDPSLDERDTLRD